MLLFFTYGEDHVINEVPMRDKYVVIAGNTEKECLQAYKQHFPVREDGVLKCANWYTEEQFKPLKERYYSDVTPFRVVIAEPSELAIKVGNFFVAIQESEEGWDYTIYEGYRLYDGGVIDDPELSVLDALKDIISNEPILSETLESVDGDVSQYPLVDYDELWIKTN